MRKFHVLVNGKSYEVEVEELCGFNKEYDKTQHVESNKAHEEKLQSDVKNIEFKDKVKVTAPMPGTILNVMITKGQEVKKRDVLFILEAMKMENELLSDVDGIIEEVLVSKSDVVDTDDILAVIK